MSNVFLQYKILTFLMLKPSCVVLGEWISKITDYRCKQKPHIICERKYIFSCRQKLEKFAIE